MDRGIYFSGYGCHAKQENSVSAVSMTAFTNGKNSSAYFRKLM